MGHVVKLHRLAQYSVELGIVRRRGGVYYHHELADCVAQAATASHLFFLLDLVQVLYYCENPNPTTPKFNIKSTR